LAILACSLQQSAMNINPSSIILTYLTDPAAVECGYGLRMLNSNVRKLPNLQPASDLIFIYSHCVRRTEKGNIFI
jgi:hypothetical protein